MCIKSDYEETEDEETENEETEDVEIENVETEDKKKIEIEEMKSTNPDDYIIKKHKDTTYKYKINRSKEVFKDTKFINILRNKLLFFEINDKDINDDNYYYIYKIYESIFQGHKTISGKSLENSIESYFDINNIKYISQVKISNNGTLIKAKELPSINENMKKKKLQDICKELDINYTETQTKEQLLNKIYKKYPDLSKEKKNNNKGIADFIILPKNKEINYGDKLDYTIIVSVKTEVRERWKGENYGNIKWKEKIHIGFETIDKLKKLTKSQWTICTINKESKNNFENLLKRIKSEY